MSACVPKSLGLSRVSSGSANAAVYTAPRFCLTNQILARQNMWHSFRLYRRHFQVTQALEVGELGRRQIHRCEGSIAHVAVCLR